MKKVLISLFMLATVAMLFCVPGVDAGVPQMINYQGTLTDKNGTPVANGNYTMEFKIYDVASGGAALWSEKWDPTTSQITVVGGAFNAMLGFLTPIPASFFADHPVAYLGIKVGTDSEMLPRQQITSVGYAFTAGNGIPKGGIIMWSGAIDQIPAGWALCDGVERTLADGTKVTPPNLKDRFVVGAGNSYAVSNIGGSATKNLSHSHSLPAHTHTVNDVRRQAGSHENDSGFDIGDYWGGWVNTGSAGNGSSEASGSASQDIMPPYYALAYIMKL